MELNGLKKHFNNDLKLEVKSDKYTESGVIRYCNVKCRNTRTGITSAEGTGEVNEYYVGGGYSNLNEFTYCGRLVLLPLFETDYDPQVNFMFYKQMGYAIYDAEAKCVHVAKSMNQLFEDKRKIGDLLYMYGPCALAFMDPKDFNSKNKEMLVRFYKKRSKMLQKANYPMQPIEKEQVLFERCLSLLEGEKIKSMFIK